VVAPQNSAAFHRVLEATGMQIGKHLTLKDRAKPYVNPNLFEKDIHTVFLSHLTITQIMENIPEEDTVRLMENCSPHFRRD
jgi:hypothetical protein